MHKTRDVDVDESLFYDKFEVNPWNFEDAEYENLNDSLFADLFELNRKDTKSFPILASITPVRKNIESLKLGIREKDVRPGDQEYTQPFDNNYSDTKSDLTSVLDLIKSPSI